MVHKLKGAFYSRFILYIAVLGAGCIGSAVFGCIYWCRYSSGEADVWVPVLFNGVFVCCTVSFAMTIPPYWKDWLLLRKNAFLTITGRVTGYRKVVADAGDATVTSYDPIIEVETERVIKILEVEKTEKGKRYTFLYLPHTNLAVIQKEESAEQ